MTFNFIFHTSKSINCYRDNGENPLFSNVILMLLTFGVMAASAISHLVGYGIKGLYKQTKYLNNFCTKDNVSIDV